MKRKLVATNLRRLAKWVKSQRDGRPRTDERNRAANIVTGCGGLLAQAGMTDAAFDAWTRRKGARRKALSDIRDELSERNGNIALLVLLALTLNTVEAATWVMGWDVGALPVNEPARQKRPLSDAQKAALARGRESARKPGLAYSTGS